MHASIRALLDEIIDYAGLFPPAQLPLEDALCKYLRYKKSSPFRWMLGRFVCPAARLPELLARAKTHADAALLSLTVLGQRGADVSDFSTKLEADLRAIEAFRVAWNNDAVIDMIEIPLPKAENVEGQPATTTGEASYLGYADAMAYHAHHAAEHLADAKLRGFLEIPRSDHWHDDVKKLAQGLSFVGVRRDETRLGLKLRCGGVTAEAFPTDAEVAFFIDQCSAVPVPWKATAGLHHPRRHRDESLKLWHQGFLNLFGAGVLAMANSLPEAALREILADRNGEHFRFSDERLAWKEWSCTTAQIVEFRSRGPTAFGSCSFEEPCQDLLAMGLLD